MVVAQYRPSSSRHAYGKIAYLNSFVVLANNIPGDKIMYFPAEFWPIENSCQCEYPIYSYMIANKGAMELSKNKQL